MSVELQNGRLVTKGDDDGTAIDDVINCRMALYGLIQKQTPDQIDHDELYYAIRLLRTSEPTRKQWVEALQTV
jgi:hypothetical protein